MCFCVSLRGFERHTPHVHLPRRLFLKLSDGRWFRGENLISSIILVTGVCVMIIGLIMMVLFPQDCSHGAEMFYCTVSNTSVPSTTSPNSGLQFINTTQNVSIFWLTLTLSFPLESFYMLFSSDSLLKQLLY